MERCAVANILLTNRCVRQCPYCFAGQEMAQAATSEYLSWENVIYLADLLQASGERRVSLLGGEPTLHPEFLDILLYLVERRFHVTFFTSGIMSKAKLEACRQHAALLPLSRVNFVCNLNNPEQTPTPRSEREALHAFLSVLGPWTMPAFTIYRPDFELDFLFDLVERYGLRKRVRLGLAHPTPGASSEALGIAEIGHVLERLYSYKDAFERLRLRPSFDCGFPSCRLTDEQLGWLTRLSGRVEFKCMPAVDITPAMQVYCCFPLSAWNRRSVFEFDSFKQITEHYGRMQERIRAELGGIYPECTGCVHREEGTCAGGGLCQVVNRLMQEDPARLMAIECLP